jgi:hypothetical protein
MEPILDNRSIDGDDIFFVPFEQSQYPKYNTGAIINYCRENDINPPDLTDAELGHFIVPTKAVKSFGSVEPLKTAPKKPAFV